MRLIAALLAMFGSILITTVATETSASAATGCTLVTDWAAQTAKAHCNTTLANERVQARAHCTHGPGTAPFTIFGPLVPGGTYSNGSSTPQLWWSIATCTSGSTMFSAELRVINV